MENTTSIVLKSYSPVEAGDSRQFETISQVVQIIDTMTASVEFMVLGRQVVINTKEVLQALFFKMLEYYQFVQADLLSQIG